METNYLTRDRYGIYTDKEGRGVGHRVMGTDTLLGNGVYNAHGDRLGHVQEFMVDMATGAIGYAVLSLDGVLGEGEKLFAVPWSALILDANRHRFVLHVTKDKLQEAPGFEKDHWPAMADPAWAQGVHRFYGTTYQPS
jgi:sporulation protein YlmC with PRC-barrel domain